MAESDDLRRENEALRERIATLHAAILRISTSLELETVLQEVVEGARALSGARYGLITTLDASGQPQDLVSSGFTPEEHRQIAAWPAGPRGGTRKGIPGSRTTRSSTAAPTRKALSEDLLYRLLLQLYRGPDPNRHLP